MAKPMVARPMPPAPGSFKQVSAYSVQARQCACCKDPPIRYFVRSFNGILLAMAFSWEKLCHSLNWYPMDDLAEGARIPREAPKPPPKSGPKTILVDPGPLPLFEGWE